LDDDDEILLALAEELGQGFVEYVGGEAYAHLILVVLESLAAVEETLVRQKAAESITKVCAALSQPQIEEYYLPLLKRLSTGEWFTSRTSATALYAAAYPLAATATRDEMRRMFAALCTDDTPMVRRAAAKELGGFSKTLSHDVLLSDLLPAFRKLASDDQDSVRLLTVDALIAIAEALTDEECKNYLGATMKAMVSDKSWRVRYMVADHFVKLSAAAGEDIVREELVVAFVALLKDNEAEVRTAAAGQIPGSSPSNFLVCAQLTSPPRAGFANLVDREIILARLMPCIRDLATDTSQHVRAALGTQISGLAPLLGKDSTIEHLLPLFLQLLKDEFPDVRLNIISKLEQVNAGESRSPPCLSSL
jgi:serine/threonine-protein phosphatase 2A regulatory subunit A